jgi:hypothetical protein
MKALKDEGMFYFIAVEMFFYFKKENILSIMKKI